MKVRVLVEGFIHPEDGDDIYFSNYPVIGYVKDSSLEYISHSEKFRAFMRELLIREGSQILNDYRITNIEIIDN